MSDRSIQANHPINLDPNLLAQLLRGIEIQEQEHGLQRLITSTSSPVPVFSDDQIRFLAPLLAEGLRTATPDQRIEYRVNPTHKRFCIRILDHGSHRRFPLCLWPTAVCDTLSQYNYDQMLANMNLNDMSYQSHQRDEYSSGLQDYILLFTRALPNGPIALIRRQGENPPTDFSPSIISCCNRRRRISHH